MWLLGEREFGRIAWGENSLIRMMVVHVFLVNKLGIFKQLCVVVVSSEKAIALHFLSAKYLTAPKSSQNMMSDECVFLIFTFLH